MCPIIDRYEIVGDETKLAQAYERGAEAAERSAARQAAAMAKAGKASVAALEPISGITNNIGESTGRLSSKFAGMRVMLSAAGVGMGSVAGEAYGMTHGVLMAAEAAGAMGVGIGLATVAVQLGVSALVNWHEEIKQREILNRYAASVGVADKELRGIEISLRAVAEEEGKTFDPKQLTAYVDEVKKAKNSIEELEKSWSRARRANIMGLTGEASGIAVKAMTDYEEKLADLQKRRKLLEGKTGGDLRYMSPGDFKNLANNLHALEALNEEEKRLKKTRDEWLTKAKERQKYFTDDTIQALQAAQANKKLDEELQRQNETLKRNAALRASILKSWSEDAEPKWVREERAARTARASAFIPYEQGAEADVKNREARMDAQIARTVNIEDARRKRNMAAAQAESRRVAALVPDTGMEPMNKALVEMAETAPQKAALIAEGFNLVRDAASSMGGAAVDAFFALGQGTANFGEVMRRATGEAIAGIAKHAAAKAMFELAEGFASLFIHPAAAAAHFQAAAIFGALAIGGGLIGGAVAGPGGSAPAQVQQGRYGGAVAYQSGTQGGGAGAGNGGGGGVVININGSMSTDRDLAAAIARALNEGAERYGIKVKRKAVA